MKIIIQYSLKSKYYPHIELKLNLIKLIKHLVQKLCYLCLISLSGISATTEIEEDKGGPSGETRIVKKYIGISENPLLCRKVKIN